MEIFKKLFQVKAKIGKISKESNNPFFKSKYFDVNALLENVEPLLNENKLVLLQPIKEGKVCTQIIDIETGEEVNSEMLLPNLTDPQKLGSAITYYRRYTLQSLLGIQAEDDDGNKASSPAPQQNSGTIPPALLNEIAGNLSKVDNGEDLKALFKAQSENVKKYPTLKGMFTARKLQLEKAASNGNA